MLSSKPKQGKKPSQETQRYRTLDLIVQFFSKGPRGMSIAACSALWSDVVHVQHVVAIFACFDRLNLSV